MSNQRKTRALALLIIATLTTAAACGDDDSADDTDVTVTVTVAKTTVPGTENTGATDPPPERFDPKPADLTAYLTNLGFVDSGRCGPYWPGRLLVYVDDDLREAEDSDATVLGLVAGVLPDGVSVGEFEVDVVGGGLALTYHIGDQSSDTTTSSDGGDALDDSWVQTANQDLADAEVGVSLQFDWAVALFPVGTFHPWDIPEPSTDSLPDLLTDERPETRSTHVVIVDSPRLKQVDDYGEYDQYDEAGNIGSNGKIDFGAGHGEFIENLIRQQLPINDSPVDNVELVELTPSVESPFIFKTSDLITTLRTTFRTDVSQDDGKLPTGGVTVKDVDIINMSLGIIGCDHAVLAAELDTILTANTSAIIVAAAGNSGRDNPQPSYYPASFAPNLRTLAVGALNESGRADWSNCSSMVTRWAKGEKVLANFPETSIGAAEWSGTSFAAANVTAALANSDNTRTSALDLLKSTDDLLNSHGDKALFDDAVC